MQDDCDLALGPGDDDDVGEDVFDEPEMDAGSTGRWTREEHHLFVKGLEMYGKGWKKIASLIKTRTVVQIRTVRFPSTFLFVFLHHPPSRVTHVPLCYGPAAARPKIFPEAEQGAAKR